MDGGGDVGGSNEREGGEGLPKATCWFNTKTKRSYTKRRFDSFKIYF